MTIPSTLKGLDKGTSNNPYCGPAALALLLDKPLHEIDKILEPLLGSNVQRELFYPEVLLVLKEQGLAFSQVGFYTATKAGGNFLICWKGHFGVMKNGIYFDNGYPDGIKQIPKLRFERAFWVQV
jgi:hypothetical protein